ncbi:MAG: glutamine synthetase [Clostridia bacterium]|nr:glutamine synthetase [Clostridia bacterium]
MNYSIDDVLQYVEEEDVKFIRIAFCDVFGTPKNVSVMPHELERAFEYGVSIDASAIKGFGGEIYSDLLLHPEPETLMWLPWRPEHGKVVRMFSHITYPDGTPFECDTRELLRNAVRDAKKLGYEFTFGAEQEFYLFKLDDRGEPTGEPYDRAGYMDVAPLDKCENIRREICLTLEQMGIMPESSHHEEGPGQCEVDFRYGEPLEAADNAMTFQSVVKAVAARNGLCADFTPKPLEGRPGNGFHINVSLKDGMSDTRMDHMIGGLLKNIRAMTLFLNPREASYERFGRDKAPSKISWSRENRSQLIRVPAAPCGNRRIELRSPDPLANPYLAFALTIYACLDGLSSKIGPGLPAEVNLYNSPAGELDKYGDLPADIREAAACASEDAFIRSIICGGILDIYRGE